MNSLRKISFDYFNEQIIISEKVNNEVQKLWLDGNEFSQIVKKIINTELMIKSVKQCKVFIINCINIDINSKENTMQINYSNSKQSGQNNKPRQATSWHSFKL